MTQTGIIEAGSDLDDGTSSGRKCVCPYCKGVFRLSSKRPAPGDKRSSCKRCGFEWKSRREDPMKCPKCGSYSWNKVAIRCRCKVCGHDWVSRKPKGPSRCPSCNSSRWNKSPEEGGADPPEKNPEDIRTKWVLERYSKGMGCLAIASELGLPLMRVMRIVSAELGLKETPRI